MPKIQNQIKYYKYITDAGVFASAVLSLLTLNILIPINFKSETAVAADASTSTTSLTLDVASSTAGVELLVTSESGTFASTVSGDEMSFNVTTNNVTGYMLSISAKSGTDLTNTTAGTSFASLSTPDGVTSAAFDTAAYNNMWGFKPNYYKTAANNDKFYPSPTTSGVTLNKTDSANTSGSYDTYTIAIGARATYTQVAGTYSNTYILNAVGNYPKYSITYMDNSGDTTVSGLPANQPIAESASTTIQLSTDEPTRTGYDFISWCSVTTTDSATTCPGTTYIPGADYTISTLDTNTITLYATWEKSMLAIQNLDPSECTTTATEVYDTRDNTVYNIQRLADGRCWLLDNLRLGAMDLVQTLSTDNTNMDPDTSFTLPESGKECFYSSASCTNGSGVTGDGFTIPAINTESSNMSGDDGYYYGVYYNFCAASAGTICMTRDDSTEDASYDICPAGWRMPTSGTNGEYQKLYQNSNYDSYDKLRAGLHLPLSGYFRYSPGSAGRQGIFAIFWSATHDDSSNTGMGSLFISSNGPTVSTTELEARYYGQSVRCVLKDALRSITYMQDITPENQTSVLADMTPNKKYILKDSRDENDYKLAKINGVLWMVQNLRFTGTSLSMATSNVGADKTIAYGTLTSGNSYDEARIQDSGNTTTGVWYNYAAASAMYITGSPNSTNAIYDICPAGWHLPTAPYYTTGTEGYSVFQDTRRATWVPESDVFEPLRTYFKTADGVYYDGNLNKASEEGVWWSATAYSYSGTHRESLVYNTSRGAYYSNGRYRNNGNFVRCVLETRTINDIIYMQEVTPLIVANTATGANATLKDSRDEREYAVGKLADGRLWMLDNLALDLTDSITQSKLTSSTTNAPDAALTSLKSGGGSSPYATSAVSATWKNSYTEPIINTAYKDEDAAYAYGADGTGKIGVYYNYCAVTAGSYCYASGEGVGDAEYDICPFGWKMPGTEYQTLLSSYDQYNEEKRAAFTMIFRLAASGSIENGTAGSQSVSTLSWSSIFGNANWMKYFLARTGYQMTFGSWLRYSGYTVRCVFSPST